MIPELYTIDFIAVERLKKSQITPKLVPFPAIFFPQGCDYMTSKAP